MHSLSQWGFREKLGFRFIFILFALIIFPFPLSNLLNIFNWYFLDIAMNDFWTWATELVAFNLLGYEEMPAGSPGSGDRTGDWIQYGLYFSLAAFGTLIWSIADRRRKSYYHLWRGMVVVTTYYLIFFMFIYGFIKVFWLQMPELRIDRLLKTYGQSSPMGLLWTFMGASKTYSVYAGLSEVIAGTLLIFRRTRTLGGLVTFGVMFNVFMLNMAYDVPVKLFSAQLMLLGLYIALIDWKALVGIFLQNKSREVTPWPPMFKSMKWNIVLFLIQLIFLVDHTYSKINSSIDRRARSGEYRPKSPLFGLYDVTTFVKNGDTIPPLMTDDERWQRLILEDPTRSIAIMMDDRMTYYNSDTDTVDQIITFHIGRDSLKKSYPFDYEKTAEGLMIEGVLENDTLKMDLKTYDLSNFYLINRGFNWVNEVPWHRYNPTPKPNW